MELVCLGGIRSVNKAIQEEKNIRTAVHSIIYLLICSIYSIIYLHLYFGRAGTIEDNSEKAYFTCK